MARGGIPPSGELIDLSTGRSAEQIGKEAGHHRRARFRLRILSVCVLHRIDIALALAFRIVQELVTRTWRPLGQSQVRTIFVQYLEPVKAAQGVTRDHLIHMTYG